MITLRKLRSQSPSINFMPDLAEFMTTEEAAKKLGFTVASVRQMVFKKKLESTRFGRALLIPKKAVADYLEKASWWKKRPNSI